MTEAPRFTSEMVDEMLKEKPSFLDRMGRSFRQFNTDLAQANKDARGELGTTAVGHILSGVAPLSVGVVGEVVSGSLLDSVTSPRKEHKVSLNYDKAQNALRQTNYQVPKESAINEKFSFMTDAVIQEIKNRPLLKELVENIGITVLYNNVLAKPSQGALPMVGATDLGLSLGIDVGAHGVHELAGKKKFSNWRDSVVAKGKAPDASRQSRLKSGVLKTGEALAHNINLSNGPTILGIRVMGEGIRALVENYGHIQKARKNPSYVKPQVENRYPERRDFQKKNDYRDRDRSNRSVYVGRGSAYDRSR